MAGRDERWISMFVDGTKECKDLVQKLRTAHFYVNTISAPTFEPEAHDCYGRIYRGAREIQALIEHGLTQPQQQQAQQPHQQT
ncbi:MAG: hypothetical protein AABX71_00230 [Nanoarchaeota archaeon]